MGGRRALPREWYGRCEAPESMPTMSGRGPNCPAVVGADILHRLPATSASSGGRLRLMRIKLEEHTSELQSLMRISYAVFCLKKKNTPKNNISHTAHRTQHK